MGSTTNEPGTSRAPVAVPSADSAIRLGVSAELLAFSIGMPNLLTPVGSTYDLLKSLIDSILTKCFKLSKMPGFLYNHEYFDPCSIIFAKLILNEYLQSPSIVRDKAMSLKCDTFAGGS